MFRNCVVCTRGFVTNKKAVITCPSPDCIAELKVRKKRESYLVRISKQTDEDRQRERDREVKYRVLNRTKLLADAKAWKEKKAKKLSFLIEQNKQLKKIIKRMEGLLANGQ